MQTMPTCPICEVPIHEVASLKLGDTVHRSSKGTKISRSWARARRDGLYYRSSNQATMKQCSGLKGPMWQQVREYAEAGVGRESIFHQAISSEWDLAAAQYGR